MSLDWFTAVKDGDVDAVKAHLEAGSDKDAKEDDYDENSALHLAAQAGHAPI